MEELIGEIKDVLERYRGDSAFSELDLLINEIDIILSQYDENKGDCQ